MSWTKQYTVWCDDGRYCNGTTPLMLDAQTKAEAQKQAHGHGWRTAPDQCPNCLHRRRPRIGRGNE